MEEMARLRWQCRRGMLELDDLLLLFLEERYPGLDAPLQEAFRHLLGEDDPRLFRWLFEAPWEAPPEYRELVQLLRNGPQERFLAR